MSIILTKKYYFYKKKKKYPKLIYKKKNFVFNSLINYQIYNMSFLKPLNIYFQNKYLSHLKDLYNYNFFFYYNLDNLNKNTTQISNFYIFNYIYIYNFFFKNFMSSFSFYFKAKIYKPYYLIFNFYKDKFLINLLTNNKNLFFFVSPGFFIKFFEKKKSFKKNKLVKFLMIKFLKKILIILNLKYLIFFIKQNPINLLELLNTLYQPIAHSFFNPLKNVFIEDNVSYGLKSRFLFFIFMKNESYSKLKKRKPGRVKRKILRKIILTNKLID